MQQLLGIHIASNSSGVTIRIGAPHLVTASREIRRVKILVVAVAIFLLVAVWGRWPYGAYTILRFGVCITATYVAVRS
ncbi:MAG: hypothetical protein ACYDHE_14255 [Candidatus Acidiferrales bacterium]